METDGDSMSVEPMRLTDAEAYVYEAIATLQYLERPATQEGLEAVAELAGPEIARILRGLRARELVEERPGGSPEYRLARRAQAIALPDDDPGAAPGKILASSPHYDVGSTPRSLRTRIGLPILVMNADASGSSGMEAPCSKFSP